MGKDNLKHEQQCAIHDVRHSAMKWWNTLSSAGRTRMCDIHTELVGNIRRWETLTEREVQIIYEAEHLV